MGTLGTTILETQFGETVQPVTSVVHRVCAMENLEAATNVFSAQVVDFKRRMATVINGTKLVSETHAVNYTPALTKSQKKRQKEKERKARSKGKITSDQSGPPS